MNFLVSFLGQAVLTLPQPAQIPQERFECLKGSVQASPLEPPGTRSVWPCQKASLLGEPMPILPVLVSPISLGPMWYPLPWLAAWKVHPSTALQTCAR